jgi:hypothetical protein
MYLIGVHKCATTEVQSLLLEHPDVRDEPVLGWLGATKLAPGVPPLSSKFDQPMDQRIHSKEVLFWSGLFPFGVGVAEFTRYVGMRMHRDGAAFVDASPDTFWAHGHRARMEDYTIAQVVQATDPHARLLLMLRDPTARVLSEFTFFGRFAANARHDIPSVTADVFHTLVMRTLTRLVGCIRGDGLRACVRDQQQHMLGNEVHSVRPLESLYIAFLSDWAALFPEEQLLIGTVEQLAASPQAWMVRVARHFRLDEARAGPMLAAASGSASASNQGPPINHTHANATPQHRRVAMWASTEWLLRTFFCPFNRALRDALMAMKGHEAHEVAHIVGQWDRPSWFNASHTGARRAADAAAGAGTNASTWIPPSSTITC